MWPAAASARPRAGGRRHGGHERVQPRKHARARAWPWLVPLGRPPGGLRLERERCRKASVCVDLRFQLDDLLLGDGIGAGNEATRGRRLGRELDDVVQADLAAGRLTRALEDLQMNALRFKGERDRRPPSLGRPAKADPLKSPGRG